MVWETGGERSMMKKYEREKGMKMVKGELLTNYYLWLSLKAELKETD